MMSVQETLRPFGITRCYKGFHHICYAIRLILADDYRLASVTKSIYMVTATHFGCSWFAVERNIRTAVARAWRVNPALLAEMAGYPLFAPPTASEFLEIVSSYILRTEAAASKKAAPCKNPVATPLNPHIT